ncbi:MAG: zinc ABC transporter substrate-binding protein, partial [Bauldia sp.]
MKRLLTALLAAAALLAEAAAVSPVIAADRPIKIVAAEGFYGEAAKATGGDRVVVENVIVAPGTDPHDFDPPPSVAVAVADAAVVIMNGAGYDHWMERLIEASPDPQRV